MKKTRWAVVGTSDFAMDWIAEAIRSAANTELAAIVSRDAARARHAAQRLQVEHYATSIETLDRSLVDGVFIVTPNQTHAPLAIAAVRRGFHVVVEKPMAPTPGDCREMILAARQTGVVLAVGHCTTWAPPVVAAKELIASGAIGRVVNANMWKGFVAPPDGKWRQQEGIADGGGPLFDLGSHSVYTYMDLFGEVTSVSALADAATSDYPSGDLHSMMLRFKDPIHATAMTSFAVAANQCEIIGTKGRLVSNEWGGRSFAGELIIEKNGTREQVPLRTVNVYEKQIENVSDHILHGTDLQTDPLLGYAVVSVLANAVESIEHRRVVPCPSWSDLAALS